MNYSIHRTISLFHQEDRVADPTFLVGYAYIRVFPATSIVQPRRAPRPARALRQLLSASTTLHFPEMEMGCRRLGLVAAFQTIDQIECARMGRLDPNHRWSPLLDLCNLTFFPRCFRGDKQRLVTTAEFFARE